MKVNSRVTINNRKIRQLTKGAIIALEMTAEALHTEVVQAQVVPRDKGALQGEFFFVDGKDSEKGHAALVHSTPYARRMYYHPEYNFQTDENPNAKGNWFEDWMPKGEHEEFAADAFKVFYRVVGGLK